MDNNNNANISFKDFMGNPSLNNFNFQPVNEQSIIKIIDRLKLKTSCGHDGISTKLSIKHEASPAITIIMNQSINTGIFQISLNSPRSYLSLKRVTNHYLKITVQYLYYPQCQKFSKE